MKKVLSVFLVAAGLVAAAMPFQASAEPIATSAVKHCGSVGGFGFGSAGGITARNMSCGFARKVAGNFMDLIPGSTSIPKVVFARGYRFKCSSKRFGSESWNTACSAQVGNRRAKTTFEWGF